MTQIQASETDLKAQLDRKLILESIFRKWNPVALGCKKEQGSIDCPLCAVYLCRDVLSNPTHCSGCPINKKTSYNFCGKTPYNELDSDCTREKYFDLIEAEIEFLISLLSLEDQKNLEYLHKNWSKKNKNEEFIIAYKQGVN